MSENTIGTEDDLGDPETDLSADEPSEESTGAPAPQYPSMQVWFERWFAPVIARKLSGAPGRGLMFCPQWWRHHEVTVRLDALWRGWEGAKISEDASAMSGWWVYHADAHLRVILDSDRGPMYLCRKDKHTDTPPLNVLLIEPPAGWFDHPD